MSDLKSAFLGQASPILFRLVWWAHIEPERRPSFQSDFFELLLHAVVRTFGIQRGKPLSTEEELVAKGFCRVFIESRIGDLHKALPTFDESTFENLARKIAANRGTSVFYRLFGEQYDKWTSRIASLSSELISSLEEINEEYVIWLKTHPEDLDKIHWHAFERLCAEILASHGFVIYFAGQTKDASSDLIAIESNAIGIETKYLIECKRFKKERKVTLDIVNAVLGAKVRGNVDHAILITTSTFSRDVIRQESSFRDKRLHLQDGEKVIEWLRDYRFKDDYGLWLPPDWDLDRYELGSTE